MTVIKSGKSYTSTVKVIGARLRGRCIEKLDPNGSVRSFTSFVLTLFTPLEARIPLSKALLKPPLLGRE